GIVGKVLEQLRHVELELAVLAIRGADNLWAGHLRSSPISWPDSIMDDGLVGQIAADLDDDIRGLAAWNHRVGSDPDLSPGVDGNVSAGMEQAVEPDAHRTGGENKVTDEQHGTRGGHEDGLVRSL